MPREAFLKTFTSHPTVRGSRAQMLDALEQRLAAAERELCIQFTRLAQVQVQLDRMIANAKSRNRSSRQSA